MSSPKQVTSACVCVSFFPYLNFTSEVAKKKKNPPSIISGIFLVHSSPSLLGIYRRNKAFFHHKQTWLLQSAFNSGPAKKPLSCEFFNVALRSPLDCKNSLCSQCYLRVKRNHSVLIFVNSGLSRCFTCI